MPDEDLPAHGIGSGRLCQSLESEAAVKKVHSGRLSDRSHLIEFSRLSAITTTGRGAAKMAAALYFPCTVANLFDSKPEEGVDCHGRRPVGRALSLGARER